MRQILNLRLVAALAFLTLIIGGNCSLHELNEENWKLMLDGEWMVQFVAPWCTSCQIVLPVWERFAKSAGKYNLKVALIDITKSPSLSGRFLVSNLPTIYHVIDGKFRYYWGQRDIDALIDYVKLKQWKSVDPISAWTNPNSFHMAIMSYFFCFSFMLKEWHGKLQEEYGLSVYSSYALFTLTTILVGVIFGLILVTTLDFVCPSRKKKRHSFAELNNGIGGHEEQTSDILQDLVNDEIEDFESDQNQDDQVFEPRNYANNENDNLDDNSMNVTYIINNDMQMNVNEQEQEEEEDEDESEKEVFHTCKLSPIASDKRRHLRRNTTF